MTHKKAERWRRVFLGHFRKTGNVTEAARMAGVARQVAYRLKKADPAFAAEWNDAEDESTDALEREAWRRACEGTDKPVFYQGEECGRIKEFSDVLLIVLLKARRPDKYRENVKLTVEDVNAAIEQELARLAPDGEGAATSGTEDETVH